MHPFGGTPLCPKCNKAVYAAEQVMGPGRKLYHKPCLACMTCNKRLDSFSLLEHDDEPYCKHCHVKNFGTRDLRQANLPQRQERTNSPPPSPTRFSFSPLRQTNTGANSNVRNINLPLRPLHTGTAPLLRPTRSLTSPTSPTFQRNTPTPPSESQSIPEEEEGEVKRGEDGKDEKDQTPVSKPTHTGRPGLGNLPRTVPLSFPLSRPRHQNSQSLSAIPSTYTDKSIIYTPPRLSEHLVQKSNSAAAAVNLLEQEGLSPLVHNATGARASPLSTIPANSGPPSNVNVTPTGTRYGSALGGSLIPTPTGSPRKWGNETPSCPRCSQSVYFAEQVKAVGKTFHKNCLRCVSCNTILDSSRLRDHNGDPYCVRCYGKQHGPQGSGYALLGKAGG